MAGNSKRRFQWIRRIERRQVRIAFRHEQRIVRRRQTNHLNYVGIDSSPVVHARQRQWMACRARPAIPTKCCRQKQCPSSIRITRSRAARLGHQRDRQTTRFLHPRRRRQTSLLQHLAANLKPDRLHAADHIFRPAVRTDLHHRPPDRLENRSKHLHPPGKPSIQSTAALRDSESDRHLHPARWRRCCQGARHDPRARLRSASASGSSNPFSSMCTLAARKSISALPNALVKCAERRARTPNELESWFPDPASHIPQPTARIAARPAAARSA